MQIPVVFMMYYNTVLHYGVEKFVKECQCLRGGWTDHSGSAAGRAGRTPDTLDRKKMEPILIQLVSPVSKDRVPKILENARGFVYCVSSMGVTGQEATFHSKIYRISDSGKESSAKIPVMMGFGIRTAEDVRPMKEIIDGAIVGSHFITLMRKHDFDPQAAADYCSTFKKELNEM